MVPACPAEMLPTLLLKTGRLPVLMGSDQVRTVMFKTDQFLSNTVGLCGQPVGRWCPGT